MKKENEKPLGDCADCGNPLKKLTKTKDWKGRKYHLCCWRKCNTICKGIDLDLKYCDSEVIRKSLLELREKVMPSN
jgi:hypothetical protein